MCSMRVRIESRNCFRLPIPTELMRALSTMNNDDGWKVVAIENGVEISKRRSGSLHTFRSRRVLKSVSPQKFITVANAIDAAIKGSGCGFSSKRKERASKAKQLNKRAIAAAVWMGCREAST